MHGLVVKSLSTANALQPPAWLFDDSILGDVAAIGYTLCRIQ